jgi:general secretion pathway protein A
MYASFYGLNEKPFSITPDPRYLFLSERHAEALAHLVYGINEAGGFIQLTGEVGTGKTTVVRSLLAQAPKHAEIALILNPRMTPAEFLLAICEELGITVDQKSEGSLKDLVDLLSFHLLKAHAAAKRIVLVVDEAQNLSVDVLEQVRLLTNLETETQKLLQIILIGQPELRELLDRVELRQLAQRITGRYHLDPLSGDEAAAYVRHRLRVAGATREIFTNGALREVRRLSGGVPRLINIICDRALLGAFTEDRHVVGAGVVRRAAGEVFGKTMLPRWLPWATGAAVGAVAVASVALVVPRYLNSMQPAPAPVAAAPAPAPKPVPPPGLDELLTKFPQETDPDNAFNKLFALWGLRYVAGSVDPCSQALQSGLECLTQRGSLAQLQLFTRWRSTPRSTTPPRRSCTHRREADMSFILDALKKSETDRQRQSMPALFEVKVAPPRRRFPLWAVGLAVLFGVNLLALLWVLLRPGSPAAETPAIVSAPASAPAAAPNTPAAAPPE